jgi:hypothetical protein
MDKQGGVRYTFRVNAAQAARLEEVMRDITRRRDGKPPDITEVFKSIVFGEYPNVVSPEARAYLRGELSALGSGDILVWV